MTKVYHISLTLILAFCSISVFSQRTYETNPDSKRANIWYFGQNAGIDFNTNPPTSLNNGKVNNSEEGGGVMCDTSGKILFYTDGRTVWNKNHDTMENGFGLMGGYSSSQTGLCLKHPENDSLFYIFNTPNFENYTNGLSYNKINIKLNNGEGKLIEKNLILNNNSSEKISAVYHANGKDIWIIGHEYGNNRFFIYLLKEDGLQCCPILIDTGVIYTFFPPLNTRPTINAGFLKFSSNNKYLVHMFSPETYTSQFRRFELYQFNNLNANLSLINTITYSRSGWGVEFSANSENLIFSDIDSFSTIFNIKTGAKKLINIKTNIQSPFLQLASDGNIYFSRWDSAQIGVYINTNTFMNISFREKFLLLNSGRYKFSLPNLFISYLQKPSVNFTYNHNCNTNTVNFIGLDTFDATSFKWIIYKSNINNPVNTSLNKNFTYTFNDTGIFNVCFIAIKNTRSDSLIKGIKITSKVRKDFLGDNFYIKQGNTINLKLKAPQSICYFWQDSSRMNEFTAKKEGIYYCKILTNSFCNLTDTITVKYCKDSLNAPILDRLNDSVFFQNITNTDSFIWYKNKEEILKGNQKFLILKDTGTYSIKSIKYGYCDQLSSNFYINKLSVFNGFLEKTIIKPNPNTGQFKIFNSTTFNLNYQIYNMLGQNIYNGIAQNGESEVNINITSGIYIFKLKFNNQTVNHKLIIQ